MEEHLYYPTYYHVKVTEMVTRQELNEIDQLYEEATDFQSNENEQVRKQKAIRAYDMMFDLIQKHFNFPTAEKDVKYPQYPRKTYHIATHAYGGRFKDTDISQIYSYLFNTGLFKDRYTIEERPKMVALVFEKNAYFLMGDLKITLPILTE